MPIARLEHAAWADQLLAVLAKVLDQLARVDSAEDLADGGHACVHRPHRVKGAGTAVRIKCDVLVRVGGCHCY